MIDKKHFKLYERTMFRGYRVNVRRGQALWLCEILDANGNYAAKTRFCGSKLEATNEAAHVIEKLINGGYTNEF